MKRNEFLKQASAAFIATQGLNPIHANAIEKKKSTPKFLFVLEGNGLPQRQIQPKNVPYIDLEDRDAYHEYAIGELPTALEPVEKYKNNMCIIQGVSGRICGGGHSNDHGTLGSYNSRDGRNIAGPTIDHLIGEKHQSVFNQLSLGINANDLDVIFNCTAADRDKPLATLCNPVSAYNRIFGTLGNKEQVEKDNKIIDYIKNNIEGHMNSFGPDPKLIHYAKAYDNILNRQNKIAHAKINKFPTLTEKYESLDHVDKLSSHFEIATAALRENITNVATMAVGVGYTHFQIDMSSLEGVSMPRHGLGHANMKNKDPKVPWAPHEEAALVRRFVFENIRKMMDEVDNLVVVYCSDAAEKHHSTCHEWPHVILSNSPSKLQLDGRFIYYPKEGVKGHKTINALHNSLLYNAGIELDYFGALTKSISDDAQIGYLKELLV